MEEIKEYITEINGRKVIYKYTDNSIKQTIKIVAQLIKKWYN